MVPKPQPGEYTIIDFTENIQLYLPKIIKFIHEVFPIKYPEDWLKNILLNEKAVNSVGHYCLGIVNLNSSSTNVKNSGKTLKNGSHKLHHDAYRDLTIKSLLMARILKSDDTEIVIEDLNERVQEKNICYW